MSNIGIVATITLHDMDGLKLKCLFITGGEVLILNHICVSDTKHKTAAELIALAASRQVIWQDITGTKHFVHPNDLGKTKGLLTIDPRDRNTGVESFRIDVQKGCS